jgi:hypothetical protein
MKWSKGEPRSGVDSVDGHGVSTGREPGEGDVIRQVGVCGPVERRSGGLWARGAR